MVESLRHEVRPLTVMQTVSMKLHATDFCDSIEAEVEAENHEFEMMFPTDGRATALTSGAGSKMKRQPSLTVASMQEVVRRSECAARCTRPPAARRPCHTPARHALFTPAPTSPNPPHADARCQPRALHSAGR